MSPLIFSSILATFIVVACIYVKHSFTYWSRRGVAQAKPSFPFGNFKGIFTRERSFGQTIGDLYHTTNAPFLGIYTSLRPGLLIRDPQVTRDILIKNFQSFWHRGFHYDSKIDSMSLNLFTASGDDWRQMRTKLTPAFTLGKLKGMFDTFVSCGESMLTCLNNVEPTQGEFDAVDVFSRFTANITTSVGFGLDSNCFESADKTIIHYARSFNTPRFKNVIRLYMSYFSPYLTKLLGVRLTDKDVEYFMRETISQNMEHRERNNVVRKDFFQMMMQLRNTGKVHEDDEKSDESVWDAMPTEDSRTSISLENIAAQSYIFFISGYESSSTTMAFCMYELAKNVHVQQKAYEDIISVLQNHDGKLTYEAISEMEYLDKCIDEVYRMHPAFDFMARECTRDYKIPNTDVVIEKGTPIYFSITGSSYDPKYYDQPEVYNPDRFTDDFEAKNSATRPYLAFGDGPRNCIGMRFSKLQTKIGVCLLLQNFSFALGEQHLNEDLRFESTSSLRIPISAIKMKLKRR